MRAVIPVVDPLILAQRKRFGVDQYDEMWEGELHMPPVPDDAHQSLEGDLEFYWRVHWGLPNNALVQHQINLAPVGAGKDWTNDYRIPDLLLLTQDRFHIRCGTHWEGAPNVVVEIHSSGDEAYEKLPFYCDLAVPEVWIIHRDSKQVELYVLHGGEYDRVDSDAENWLRSPATGIEMQPTGTGKLAIRVAGNAATQAELPTY
jgi:hypothetical protein